MHSQIIIVLVLGIDGLGPTLVLSFDTEDGLFPLLVVKVYSGKVVKVPLHVRVLVAPSLKVEPMG